MILLDLLMPNVDGFVVKSAVSLADLVAEARRVLPPSAGSG